MSTSISPNRWCSITTLETIFKTSSRVVRKRLEESPEIRTIEVGDRKKLFILTEDVWKLDLKKRTRATRRLQS